jgi:hypothetical protein
VLLGGEGDLSPVKRLADESRTPEQEQASRASFASTTDSQKPMSNRIAFCLPMLASISSLVMTVALAREACSSCSLALPWPLVGTAAVCWLIVSLAVLRQSLLALWTSLAMTSAHALIVLLHPGLACPYCLAILALEVLSLVAIWAVLRAKTGASHVRSLGLYGTGVACGAFVGLALHYLVDITGCGNLALSPRGTPSVREDHRIYLITHPQCPECKRLMNDLPSIESQLPMKVREVSMCIGLGHQLFRENNLKVFPALLVFNNGAIIRRAEGRARCEKALSDLKSEGHRNR